MKKLLVTCVCVGLLAGALAGPADAGKKRKPKRTERVVEGTYDNPAIGIPGVVGTSSAGGAVEFGVSSTERFFDVEITDGLGQPVMATMSQNTDPADASYEIFATFCGTTDGPVEVAPGLAIRVSVYTIAGPSHPTCIGPATSGTIKATLSNLP